MMKISCIVPTYNEEARIANVLRAISDHPLVDEVIVVDDGSKDKTKEAVSRFSNIKFILHAENRGKSAAICTGMKAAQGKFLLFLDADLVGLTPKNINDLVMPILENRADVSISLRKNAPKLWHRIGMDYISGERVFRKSLLEGHIEDILKLPKFGLEVFFNRWIIKNKCRISIVRWPNVDSPFKYKKYGWYKGIMGDIKMMLDIFRTVSPFGPVYQIVKMKRLIIK